MFLTPDELTTLTGTPRRPRQIAWLVREGWKFRVDYNGRPVVARAEMEAQMVTNAPAPQKSRLNWDKVA
jgi:hypothetical protein